MAALAHTEVASTPSLTGASTGTRQDGPILDRAGTIFEARKRETLAFIADALDRIQARDGSKAALREVEAFLLELLALFDRDPALELAADDLYRAAAIMVALQESGTRVPGSRSQRVLKSTTRRFEARIAAAFLNDSSPILRFN
jgi:hypothetical protein